MRLRPTVRHALARATTPAVLLLAASGASYAQASAIRCPTEPIGVGVVRSGTLGASSCQLEPGYLQYYRLEVGPQHATQTLRFDLQTGDSLDQEVVLQVLDANGRPAVHPQATEGPGYRDLRRLAAGTYYVRVGTLEPGERGRAYRLAVVAEGSERCRIDNATEPIASGETRVGTLAMTDCAPTQEAGYRKTYRLTVPASATLQVDVASDDLETAVAVYGKDSRGFLEGRAGGRELGRGSRYYDIVGPGTHWVTVSGEKPLQTGSYRVTLRNLGPAGYRSLCGTWQAKQSPIAVGETRVGALADSSCRLTEGAQYGKYYQLGVSEPKDLRLTLRSSAFAPRLLLLDGDGRLLVAANGVNGVAELAGQMPQGRYHLVASSVGAWSSGRYELSVAGASAGTDSTGMKRPACAAHPTVEPGTTYGVEIDAASCRLPDGTHLQSFHVAPTTPQRLTIDLHSDRLNAFLLLYDPQEKTIAGDLGIGGARSGSRSRSISAELSPGTHHLRVYARRPAPWDTAGTLLGKYQLAVRALAPGDAPRRQCTLDSLRLTIAAGEKRTGRISTASCAMNNGEYADFYRLDVAEPTTVQIGVNSLAIEPGLALADAEGNTLAVGHGVSNGTTARLRRTLAPGRYLVAVSGKRGALGDYELVVGR